MTIMSKQLICSALIIALLSIIGAIFPTAQAASVPAITAAPGELDPTFAGFGTGGVVTPGGLRGISGVAVQPDGKLVVAGPTGASLELGVFRYLPNGTLDDTFGNKGKAIFPNMFTVKDVALQKDGKIVVGGTRFDDFQLARLTASGVLDTSFARDGWAEDVDDQLETLNAILVQDNGKIVACGSSSNGDRDFGVIRYTTTGERDQSFGSAGKVNIGFGGVENCGDIVQQSDGKLIVAGIHSYIDGNDFAVARLEINGTLDDTKNGDSGFDGDGTLTTGFGGDEDGLAVALQPDGKIVVIGNRHDSNSTLPDVSFVARYHAEDGKLDNSLDGDGKLTIPTDDLRALAIQPDGKLLALGYHESPDGDHKLALHRLLTNGAPDTTFNGEGKAWIDFGGKDQGQAFALLPDGRIVAGGTKGNAAVLVQVWPDGTVNSGGQQTHTFFAPPVFPFGSDHYAEDLTIQPDGKLLVAGEFRNFAGVRSDAFVSRFLPNGQPDLTFGTMGSTRGNYSFISTASAIALQPDGKIVVAGYDQDGPYVNFLVMRFHSNGAPDLTFDGDGVQLVDFANQTTQDYATDLAIAPDGTIVVAGNAIVSRDRRMMGVARLTSTGQFDSTFDTDGKITIDLSTKTDANAVAVQNDGKIVLAGKPFTDDFLLVRLLPNGAFDESFGPTKQGFTIDDLGGSEVINALALAPNGWIYAAGTLVNPQTSYIDMVVAQYTPEGVLGSCPATGACNQWNSGLALVRMGTINIAFGLDVRSDNQVVVAGCVDGRMAGAQLNTAEAAPIPLRFITDFVGESECAQGVAFSSDKVVMAGHRYIQQGTQDIHIALARFQSTPDATKLDQAISFAALPDRLTTDPAFEISASASSGLPVNFTSDTDAVCSMNGTTLALSGEPGACTITAEQLGDATHNPAPSVTRSFEVRDPTRQNQTISFQPLADKLVGETITLNATASSGLAVAFESSTPAVCTFSGTSVELRSSGICTILASQQGDAAYNPAPAVTQSFAVRDQAKREQTISIEPESLPTQLMLNQPLTIKATTSSGLPVEIVSTTPSVCMVVGATVIGESAGVCRVSIFQDGDAQWNPAHTEATFTIGTSTHTIWLPLTKRS